MATDRAECSRIAESVEALLPALERFNRFEAPDRSGSGRQMWSAALDQPLPQRGEGLDSVLSALEQTIIPNGLRSGAPGFSGWVTTAPTTAGVAAMLASSVAGAQRYWVQAFNALETLALQWLIELLDLGSGLQGLFLSGGSVANLIGLGAARQYAGERVGCDPSRDGLPPDRRWRVYASSEVHHCVFRAAGVLGIGRQNVERIDVDDELRVLPGALERALERDARAGVAPIAIVASAGTVNTGAVDPISDLARIAAERGIWLHVDGAYGLFGRLDPRIAHLFEGVERAQSIAVDPHKWLAAPPGCGAAFVRDRALLERAFTMEPADYAEGAMVTEVRSTFDSPGDASYHQLGVEMSARPRGVTVWAILKEIGAEGLRERIVRHNDFARHVAMRAGTDPRLEALHEPTLSICCFRYRPNGASEVQIDRLNADIAQRLREEGIVPSTTRVRGTFAIRPCFINPRTMRADVDGLVDRVCALGDALAPVTR